MQARPNWIVRTLAVFAVFVAIVATFGSTEARAQYSLTSGSYFQAFDALGTTTGSYAGGNLGSLGSGTASMQGWFFGEGGSSGNVTITAGNGSSNTGDTYNFGPTGGADRALGGLLSSNVKPYWGFYFTNNTGGTITGLSLSYVGEVWRTATTSRADKISFGYSTSATTLSSTATGWTNLTTLDFSYTPTVVGSGSLIASSTISGTIDTLSLANGSSMFLRWVDSDVTGSDDGLAIDNFSLVSLSGTSTPPPPATTGLFWDANGSTAGVGGSGTWTTSGSTFATTVDGTAVGTLAASGAVAFAGTAGTVTVSGTVAPPGGLQFSTSGYTVTGGVIALTGSAASTVTTDAVVTATVTAALTQASGSAALVKAGPGTLSLGGANAYLGGTTISAGTLAATANSALGSGSVSLAAGGLLAASGVTLGNAITVAASGTATGSLVAGWDFQTAPGTLVTTNTASPPTPNVYTASFGAGTLYLNGTAGSSVWTAAASNTELNAFGGTTINAGPGFSTSTASPAALALVSGAASGASFTANGKSAVFAVDMTGKQNLVVSLAEQRTTSGFASEVWSYSTDGTNWTDFQTLGAADIPTSFGLLTLNTISGLNNAANAYVKVTFDGATNASGNVRLDNIQFNAVALGTQVVAAATLGTDVIGGVAEFSGPVSLGGSLNLLAATNATVVLSGTMSGGGGIRHIGAGTVVLASDNTYSGGTTVETGQLRLGAGGAAGSVLGSVQLLSNSASIVIDRSDDLVFATSVSGSGGLFKEGGNVVTLSGSSSYTGGTTLFAGSLVVGNGGTQGGLSATGFIDFSAGTTLAFNRSDDVLLSGSVTGDGTLTQTGAGKLTLAQTGGLGNATLRVESGVVDLNRGGASLVGIVGAANAVQLAGGVLQLTSDSGEETKFVGAEILVEADSTLAINRSGTVGHHVTTGFAAPITLVNSSTLSFDFHGAFSTNTLPVVRYKGTTTYTGTVTLESAAGIGVTNSSGGTAEVILAAPVVDLGNAFGITKFGDQVLTLAAANTFTGPTRVREGILQLADPAALSASGVTILAGAQLTLAQRVQATVPTLVNNGLVDVGLGRLTVMSGFTSGSLASQVTTGIVNGGTTGITSTAAASTGGAFSVGWLDNGDGSFTFGYAAAGDSNLDNVVDLVDLLNTVGSGKYDAGVSANWSEGDFNYDGIVDLVDLLSLVGGGLYDQGDYTAATRAPRLFEAPPDAPIDAVSGAVATVPEPSTWALATAAAGILLLMIRRRSRTPSLT